MIGYLHHYPLNFQVITILKLSRHYAIFSNHITHRANHSFLRNLGTTSQNHSNARVKFYHQPLQMKIILSDFFASKQP